VTGHAARARHALAPRWTEQRAAAELRRLGGDVNATLIPKKVAVQLRAPRAISAGAFVFFVTG
jgi:hypothetical protein